MNFNLRSGPVSNFTIFCMLLVWKTVDIAVSLIVPYVIPYLGFFSYGITMFEYGMPDFIRALTNFDGIFYISIGIHGYKLTEQAFFPLYPILLFNVWSVIHNPILAGLLVSLTSFVIGFMLFKRYLSFLTDKENIFWVLLFLLAYPTSYYFGVLYTESLFFMLLIGTLYCLKKKYFWQSMIFAFCASLTRVVGVLVILPIGITLIKEVTATNIQNPKDYLIAVVRQWRIMLVGIASAGGLATYCFYLWKTLGDPLYFIHAQESFGANRSSSLITPFQVLYRYLRIFITADFSFQYVIAAVECVFYLMALSLICFDVWRIYKNFKEKKLLNFERLGLAVFSLATVVVPSLTGTLTAMPRYTLLALTIILVVTEIKNKWIKMTIFCLFLILHIIFLSLFIQGYYVT